MKFYYFYRFMGVIVGVDCREWEVIGVECSVVSSIEEHVEC